MRLQLLTWNSTNINDGSVLNAYILPGQLASLSADVVTVPRAGNFPFVSTNVQQPHTFQIQVVVGKGYNINTARELMKGIFNISDSQRHNLIAQDRNDSDRQYYLTGYPRQIRTESELRFNSFYVTFQVEYPYWRQVNATVDSWDITASGDSDTIANAGNIRVPPIFTITPTTTKAGGLQYRRFVTLYNNMDKSAALPLDITGGGLDVQSLIDANKMQADGDDFRVWEDGGFKDRWLSGMDSDSDPAKCWTNEFLSPRHEGVLESVFDSDDTTIYFTETKASMQFLRALRLQSNKALLLESEVLGFTDSDIDTLTYTIANVSRAQKGTTAVSHLAASVVRHLEHDLWILYGDSDATAPDVDNNFQPMPDLTSTNAAWSFANYYSTLSNRPGAWKGERLSSKTGLSYTFTDSDNAFADLSNVLGLALIGAADLQIQNEGGTLAWMFSHPCGVTAVTYSGDVYATTAWPGVVGLQYLQTNAAWFTVQSEVAPAVGQTWESFGPHVVSLSGTYETIRFVLDGQLDDVTNAKAMAQFHTVTASFDSDNLPTVSVGDEQTINFFDFTLTNNTTGEYIKVTTPCPVNTALTIDCEAKRAYLADGTRVNVILSSDREGWLDLLPGNNALVFTDAGTVAVNVQIQHRDRVL